MTPRKAIYTEAERKARKSAQNSEWNKENTVVVNMRMSPEDKAIFEQYANWKGERYLSRMFRNCVERCMREDGWTYDPTLNVEGDQDQPGETEE